MEENKGTIGIRVFVKGGETREMLIIRMIPVITIIRMIIMVTEDEDDDDDE